MAYEIIAENCTICTACEMECPNAAISFKSPTYVIDPDLCTECQGQYDTPQCVAICPIPETCVQV